MGLKRECKRGAKKKKSLLSVGQTKQTHIIILLGKHPNQYLVTDEAGRFDVCCCPVFRLILHHESRGVNVCRNIRCDGVKQWLMVRNVCWFGDSGSSHVHTSDSVLFLTDERPFHASVPVTHAMFSGCPSVWNFFRLAQASSWTPG